MEKLLKKWIERHKGWGYTIVEKKEGYWQAKASDGKRKYLGNGYATGNKGRNEAIKNLLDALIRDIK